MKIIDLSLPLYTGMPVFPGDPEVSITLVHTIERNGWDLRRLEINSHDGTHVNVPSHMIASGRTLDDYALADFAGRRGFISRTCRYPRRTAFCSQIAISTKALPRK